MKFIHAARALWLGVIAATAAKLRTNDGEATVKEMSTGSRPRTVALGFHGEYHRKVFWEQSPAAPPKCSDYFQSADNIHKNIVKPLQDAGVEVRIYFHSNFGACPQMDSRLVGLFGTNLRNHTFTARLPQIVDSYLRVVRMIADDIGQDDDAAIVLLRFDAQYKKTITSLNIDWDKIHFAFRDKQWNWDHCRMTSDLFHILPRQYVDPFLQAVEWSGDNTKSAGYCNHGGNPHFVYEPLSKSVGVGKLAFIEQGFLSSRPPQEMSPEEMQQATPSQFIEISRACSTTTEC
eukprot:TRINITY_DN9067_c0_g1_i2.p1 TRINITY_DN9067_c0_g1~~TRINITY_DN9067_c0_g1_i2.p1  ORF type:complete len:290 (-),score=34.81 TRINITY_DN9067_c0_g1_i2:147-1016(-)